MGVCACSHSGDKEKTVSCKLTKAIPGLPCMIMSKIVKVMYMVSKVFWQLYTMQANMCKTPINPL